MSNGDDPEESLSLLVDDAEPSVEFDVSVEPAATGSTSTVFSSIRSMTFSISTVEPSALVPRNVIFFAPFDNLMSFDSPGAMTCQLPPSPRPQLGLQSPRLGNDVNDRAAVLVLFNLGLAAGNGPRPAVSPDCDGG